MHLSVPSATAVVQQADLAPPIITIIPLIPTFCFLLSCGMKHPVSLTDRQLDMWQREREMD